MKPVILIDGVPVAPAPDVDVTSLHPGTYLVFWHGRAHEVRVSGNQVAVDGHQMTSVREDPREWKGGGKAAGAKGRVSLVAPMPGKIVKVLVAAGAEVEAGQGMVVIEAMKMQNELKAPKSGRVAALEVEVQDNVTAGMVLAVIG